MSKAKRRKLKTRKGLTRTGGFHIEKPVVVNVEVEGSMSEENKRKCAALAALVGGTPIGSLSGYIESDGGVFLYEFSENQREFVVESLKMSLLFDSERFDSDISDAMMEGIDKNASKSGIIVLRFVDTQDAVAMKNRKTVFEMFSDRKG